MSCVGRVDYDDRQYKVFSRARGPLPENRRLWAAIFRGWLGGPDTVVDVPEDASPLPLANESRAVLYRVAQEALRNAVLHAHARHITVRLAERDGGAELTVADDGTGFDVEAAERRRPGMGLFTMRERVGLVDGRLTIDSAPRRGTRIAAWVPGTGAPPAAADEAETSVARRSA